MNKSRLEELMMASTWIARDPVHAIFGEFVNIQIIDDYRIQKKIAPLMDKENAPKISNWISSLITKNPVFKEVDAKHLFQSSDFANSIWNLGQPSQMIKNTLLLSGKLDRNLYSNAFKKDSFQDLILQSGQASEEQIIELWKKRISNNDEIIFTTTPNLPKKLIDALIEKGIIKISEPLLNLNDEHFEKIFIQNDVHANSEILKNPKIPSSLMQKIVTQDKTDWVRFNAILNPNCPLDILELLAHQVNQNPRCMGQFYFGKNPNTPTYVFEILEDEFGSLAHPNYPVSKLDEIIDSGKERVVCVRAQAAQNTMLNPIQIEKLLSDSAVEVRASLAENIATPDYVLKLLGLEFNKKINLSLFKNKRIHSDRIEKILYLNDSLFLDRLLNQIEGRSVCNIHDFNRKDFNEFLSLLPCEEDFVYNKKECQKRLKKLKKSKDNVIRNLF